MDWRNWGFKDFPLRTEPITKETLNLFIGRNKEIITCDKLLNTRNRIIVIEGARGIGTTSFANYLKFEKHRNVFMVKTRSIIGENASSRIISKIA